MLVLTRKQGSSIYGGTRLTEDLEQTFDHKITVEEIANASALVSLEARGGQTSDYLLTAANDEVFFDGVQLCLLGIRHIPSTDELIARIGINAHKSYRVVRDDAVKKVA